MNPTKWTGNKVKVTVLKDFVHNDVRYHAGTVAVVPEESLHAIIEMGYAEIYDPVKAASVENEKDVPNLNAGGGDDPPAPENPDTNPEV